MELTSKAPSTRASADLRPGAFFALGQLVLAVSEGHGEKGGWVPKTTLQFEDSKEQSKESEKPEPIKYHMKKDDDM